MKKIITLITIVTFAINVNADKYYTKTGKISFYSSAPMEKIEAHNHASGILLNTTTGDLRFSVLIKSFVFEKKLMQEHFNENYMESNKYPKSKFSGKILNIEKVNFAKDGNYPVKVSGKLNIHGKTKSITETGSLFVKNGKPTLSSSFSVTLTDYDIKIPRAVRNKVAKDVKIEIAATLKKL